MITRIVMAPRRAELDAEFAHEVYLAFDLTNQPFSCFDALDAQWFRTPERVISRVRAIVR